MPRALGRPKKTAGQRHVGASWGVTGFQKPLSWGVGACPYSVARDAPTKRVGDEIMTHDLEGKAHSVDEVRAPTADGVREGPAWLQGPPEVHGGLTVEPVARRKPRTRAEAFEAKREARQAAQDGKAHPGQCPRCSRPVLYSRALGILTVIDAIPVAYESTWQSKVEQSVWGLFVVVRGLIKPVMHKSDVAMYKAEYVHLEHVSCGKVTPRLTEPPKSPKEDSDVPPFDGEFRKPWRCWDCREMIQPEQQGIVIHYDGPDISYYYCHCDKACEPAVSVALGKPKVRHPKINPRTMKYEEPKKGEVIPE